MNEQTLLFSQGGFTEQHAGFTEQGESVSSPWEPLLPGEICFERCSFGDLHHMPGIVAEPDTGSAFEEDGGKFRREYVSMEECFGRGSGSGGVKAIHARCGWDAALSIISGKQAGFCSTFTLERILTFPANMVDTVRASGIFFQTIHLRFALDTLGKRR
jgi:hypothetical protein